MIKAKRRECSREEKAVKLMEQPRTMRIEKCSLELVTWVETIRDLTRAAESPSLLFGNGMLGYITLPRFACVHQD